MTLEEYYELEVLFNEQDRLIKKIEKSCMNCIFFEEKEDEEDINLRYLCKLMPTSVKKSPFDHCGQFEEK